MIELLRRSALFAALPEDALHVLAAECTTQLVPGKSVLFRQGDPSDGMYLVARGRLQIEDETAGAVRVLRHEGRGGHVGELSLLTGDARSATVRAVRDTALVRLTPDAFHRVMAAHPTAALELARSVTKRFLAHPDRAPTTISTIALVAAERGTNVGRFARDFARALEAIAKTAFVDETRIASEIFWEIGAKSTSDEASTALSEAFDRIESQHRYTLYVTDAEDTAWTRRCLRHADLIVEVARGERGDGVVRDAPAARLESAAERHLVVVHAPGSLPPPCAARLAEHPYDAHHFAEDGSASDIARMARLIAGCAYGVALSGGGSRTVAYVGVLRAIVEAGIPIDVIAGTSGGAMLGAMGALGWTPEQMHEAVRQIDRTPLWLDLCPPLLSIMSGRVYERMLHTLFGDARIEDLRVPFFPVCASLDDGAVVVPARGEVWRAIRASSSLPGIWPPVAYDGRLLIDGGISNNLPVDLVRARCGRGSVVASDVGAESALDTVRDELQGASGWTLLARRLWPFGARARGPGLLDVIVRATCAAGTRHRASVLSDASLFIEPLSVPGGTSVDALVARGYEAARAALDRAPPSLLGVRADTST